MNTVFTENGVCRNWKVLNYSFLILNFITTQRTFRKLWQQKKIFVILVDHWDRLDSLYCLNDLILRSSTTYSFKVINNNKSLIQLDRKSHSWHKFQPIIMKCSRFLWLNVPTSCWAGSLAPHFEIAPYSGTNYFEFFCQNEMKKQIVILDENNQSMSIIFLRADILENKFSNVLRPKKFFTKYVKC